MRRCEVCTALPSPLSDLCGPTVVDPAGHTSITVLWSRPNLIHHIIYECITSNLLDCTGGHTYRGVFYCITNMHVVGEIVESY